ncbi:hypothetical protein GCM10028824_30050 [Hymenobacter segetis]|uniref:Carboxypeptidase-like regulatory domain-containing protein n=1 Tax=Hymenobacter segetis TaxID=2025509 RepID=A0ABU9LWG9_9BACT
MRRAVSLSVPQPCSESWAAMMPTATGRHCDACQHTVVDFTLKTDAEILAYLAGAAGTRTCGRFAAGQLERPLQRAAAAAPTARWRAWLAAAVAVWGVREGSGVVAQAQAPAEWRARYWGGPVPSAPVGEEKGKPLRDPATAEHVQITTGAPTMEYASSTHLDSLASAPSVLRGTVIDARAHESIPGVTVLIKGTTTGVSTVADGSFLLPVPQALLNKDLTLVFSSVGFVTEERLVHFNSASQLITMQMDTQVLGGMEMYIPVLPPAPWHPRAIYYWGKYWLTRPFRRS